jgi:hypothetical protein
MDDARLPLGSRIALPHALTWINQKFNESTKTISANTRKPKGEKKLKTRMVSLYGTCN